MGADIAVVRMAGLPASLLCAILCTGQGTLLAGAPNRPADDGYQTKELNAASINFRLGSPGQTARDRKSRTKLLVMREFLRELTADERIAVLKSFVLVNGAVASFHTGPLKTRLSPEVFDEKVRALSGPFKELPPEHSGEPRRRAELATLLKDASEKTRKEFLDSMVLEDGVLVSVDIAGLRREMGVSWLKNTLDKLAFDSHGGPGSIGPDALCGNGWRTHSTCVMASGDNGDEYSTAAPADANNVCFSSCGRY